MCFLTTYNNGTIGYIDVFDQSNFNDLSQISCQLAGMFVMKRGLNRTLLCFIFVFFAYLLACFFFFSFLVERLKICYATLNFSLHCLVLFFMYWIRKDKWKDSRVGKREREERHSKILGPCPMVLNG